MMMMMITQMSHRPNISQKSIWSWHGSGCNSDNKHGMMMMMMMMMMTTMAAAAATMTTKVSYTGTSHCISRPVLGTNSGCNSEIKHMVMMMMMMMMMMMAILCSLS